ncbi:hypothetical protein FRC12_009453 [Ceratobasidium sp. 428]|nr:hypothetical protein FRC12_009453 [Ceratobasidium sp. 428]
MSLRIVLSVRGSLQAGGAYSGTTSSGVSRSHPSNSGAIPGSNSGPHIISTRATHPVVNIQTERHHTVSGGGTPTKTNSAGGVGTGRQTYTLDEMRGQRDWQDDAVSNASGPDYVKGGEISDYGVPEDKQNALGSEEDVTHSTTGGVKVKVDREVDYRRDM